MDFDAFFKNLPKFEEHTGDVFYDPRTNRFVQVRGIHDDYVICGDFTVYYEDAKTNISNQQLSHKYVNALEKIMCIDNTEYAVFDGIGWRTKDQKRPTN